MRFRIEEAMPMTGGAAYYELRGHIEADSVAELSAMIREEGWGPKLWTQRVDVPGHDWFFVGND